MEYEDRDFEIAAENTENTAAENSAEAPCCGRGKEGREPNLTRSVLKLMRAMRRRPVHHREDRFSPAVERMLHLLSRHEGCTSSMLCEMMDVRPSSMSELLGKMQEQGLIVRKENENDRRSAIIELSQAGRTAVQLRKEQMDLEYEKLASCFSEEELKTFCEMCDRLSAHIEDIAAPEDDGPAKHCGRGRCGHGHMGRGRGHMGPCEPGHHGHHHHGKEAESFIYCRRGPFGF